MNFSTRQQTRALAAPSAGVPEYLSPRVFVFVVLCLVAVVFAVYSPGLDFQFVLDDHRYTTDPRIQNSGHVWDYFANYTWAQFTGGPPSFYRPLFILWLRINFILNALSPWGWHFLAIATHLTVAVLLGLLAWRLLGDRVAALLAATLFALHPAQTESVALISVPDPLMSICILGATLLYLKPALRPAGGQAPPKKSRKLARIKGEPPASSLWFIASACVGLAALLIKETALMLPVMFFVLALLRPRASAGPDKKGPDEKEGPAFGGRLVQAIRETWPFAGATLIYLVMRHNAFGGRLGALTQHLPWTTVLLSWPATLWFYVKVLLWPVRSHAFADPTLVERFSARGVLLPAVGVGCAVALLASGLFRAWRKAERELPEAAGVECALLIGTLLLVLPILPALHLNALNPGDFLHGRYTYLPSAGLMLLLATGWHLSGTKRIPLLCAGGLLAVSFAVLAVSQERQWKDDLTIYTMAHALAPHNAPVAQNLADARVQAALRLADDGRCSEAMPVFEQVSQQYPQDWYAWAGLGECFVQLNDLPKAEASLHRAADLSHQAEVIQMWQELRAHMGLPSTAPSN